MYNYAKIKEFSMEAIYPFAHVIHLILAIMFLGYVFSDVAIISGVMKKLTGDTKKQIMQEFGKRSFKIFPLSLISLALSTI